jgi:hypothetical protein
LIGAVKPEIKENIDLRGNGPIYAPLIAGFADTQRLDRTATRGVLWLSFWSGMAFAGQHLALVYCLSMVFFGEPVTTFPDHALRTVTPKEA